MKRNAEMELTVDSLAFGGQGVAKVKDFVVFVKGAIPGDRVLARIIKKKKKHAEAKILEILEPSPDRIEPKCQYFGICGGCKIQTLPYRKQLFYKRRQVVESFAHIGGLKDLEIRETLPSPETWFYRNKMEFSFSDRRWLLPAEIASGQAITDRNFALGFHIAGFFDKIVDLKTCWLQSDRSREIVNWVRDYAVRHNIDPYNMFEHSGYLRFLVIREGKNSGQRMVNIVTRCYRPDTIEQLAKALRTEFPDTTSIVNNVTEKVSNVAFGDQEYLLHGQSTIDEEMAGYRFRISANSFFQTNTGQAEQLYRLIKKLGDFRGDELVYDLYSGTGTIAIFISDAVSRAVGFEVIESCLSDAEMNARLNDVRNCRFVCADLMKFDSFIRPDEKPELLIIDPPRAGMHPKTVRAILKLLPRRIIHVSCNPATLARDLAMLCAEKYTVDFVQPVDMFPQTGHMEVVVRLRIR